MRRDFPRLTTYLRKYVLWRGQGHLLCQWEFFFWYRVLHMRYFSLLYSPASEDRQLQRYSQCSLFFLLLNIWLSVNMPCLWDCSLVPAPLLLKTKSGPGKCMLPAYLSILDSEGCHNKGPQNRWLKTVGIYFPTVSEARTLKSRIGRIGSWKI